MSLLPSEVGNLSLKNLESYGLSGGETSDLEVLQIIFVYFSAWRLCTFKHSTIKLVSFVGEMYLE